MATTMNRRTLLQSTATGLAGLGTGYVLLHRSTDTATASVSANGLTISDASHVTKDGTIKTVTVNVSGEFSYDLPAGKNPHRWQIKLQMTNGKETATLDTTHGNARYLRYSGSYELGGDLTETNLYSASDFSAPEGKVKIVTIGFIVKFKVTNPNGGVLARAVLEDTAKVKVTNKAYTPENYGSASGSGSLKIIDD